MLDFKEFKIQNCDGVYSPVEDSFFIGDYVKEFASGKTLDLGTGTGYSGIIAALKGCDVTFADINEKSVNCAKVNAELNKLSGKFVVTDLFDRLDEKFNTIIFNPPYLISDGIKELDLDGGKDGREVIDRFLNQVKSHVLKDNKIILLESSLNHYEKDAERLDAKVFTKDMFFEKLAVLVFSV